MKLILSLDGGGIRERFIVELLGHIQSSFGLNLSEIFDMVIGVSAGALTAGLIATNQFDGSSVFEPDFTDSSFGFDIDLEPDFIIIGDPSHYRYSI